MASSTSTQQTYPVAERDEISYNDSKDLCDDYDFDQELYPDAANFLSSVRDDIMNQVVCQGKTQANLYIPLTERILRHIGGFGDNPSHTFDKLYRHGMVTRSIHGADVDNNIVHVPSAEGDVFINRTALVQCGTFADVCMIETEHLKYQPVMMAMVLDYDVRIVNGRRLRKKNFPRVETGTEQIQMFSEITPERCFTSAMFATLNQEAIRVAIHDPRTMSVMYDSKKHPTGLKVKDLFGRYLDHKKTMSVLDGFPGDFNAWSFYSASPLTPKEDKMMDFLENELIFKDLDQLNIAKWITYIMIRLEKCDTDAVVIMTDTTIANLFWKCSTNNDIRISKALIKTMSEKCEWVSALYMFNLNSFDYGKAIINPLTYTLRVWFERCWVYPATTFLDTIRTFFTQASCSELGMGLFGNEVYYFEAFVSNVLLVPSSSVKDKLIMFKMLLFPERLYEDDEPEWAVAIEKSRCSVCLSALGTSGSHTPCGHIFGHRCALKLKQCGLCKTVISNPLDLRMIYLNCFEFSDVVPN